MLPEERGEVGPTARKQRTWELVGKWTAANYHLYKSPKPKVTWRVGRDLRFWGVYHVRMYHPQFLSFISLHFASASPFIYFFVSIKSSICSDSHQSPFGPISPTWETKLQVLVETNFNNMGSLKRVRRMGE